MEYSDVSDMEKSKHYIFIFYNILKWEEYYWEQSTNTNQIYHKNSVYTCQQQNYPNIKMIQHYYNNYAGKCPKGMTGHCSNI